MEIDAPSDELLFQYKNSFASCSKETHSLLTISLLEEEQTVIAQNIDIILRLSGFNFMYT